MHPFIPHELLLEEHNRRLERNVRFAHHRRQEQLEAGQITSGRPARRRLGARLKVLRWSRA
jgi:hypothetical protein